ncbi:MAG: glycosyltransferase, partial [Bacteroidia bacterium]|nr:glycosyltransferase [Bacteroidia bacterium]
MIVNNTNAFITTNITIIVPMRNEEKNILNCLTALNKQSVSKEKYEIIVVDDSSEDNSVAIVQQFIQEHKELSIKLYHLNTSLSGKKNAIKTAINNGVGELIVTTDADCVMNPNWLFSIVDFYEKTNAQMIVGPVCYYDEKTILDKMQSLEFNALVASTAAAIYYHKPIMCNGANLAYTKTMFIELNGFEGIDEISTGDDVLLMYKLAQKEAKKIKFLKTKDAVVYTKAKSTIAEFVNQRIRWASKPMKFLNFETRAVSLIIFMTNCSFLYLLISSICLLISDIHSYFLLICLILLLIKCFIDFLLLFLATSFFKKRGYLVYFIPQQIVYSMYVIL